MRPRGARTLSVVFEVGSTLNVTPMRRIRLALLAIAAVAACDNTLTGTVPAEDAGNYVLRSMNDTLLPYLVLVQGTTQVYVIGDTIFMGVDGRYTDRSHFRRLLNGVEDFPVD